MISYLILFLVLAFLAYFSYRLFRRDLLSPSFISCLCYLLSISLAIIGLCSWNSIVSLNISVITLITIGLLSFILGEFFARKLPFLKPKPSKSSQAKTSKKTFTYHSAPLWLCAITTLISLVTSFSFIHDLKNVCAYYADECSATSIPQLIHFYRTKSELFSATSTITTTTAQSTSEPDTTFNSEPKAEPEPEDQIETELEIEPESTPPSLSTLSKQALKLCNVLAIFFTYFLISAFFYEPNYLRHFYQTLLNYSIDPTKRIQPLRSLKTYLKKSRKPIYLLVLLFAVIPSLLNSSRSTLFHIVVAAIFFYIFIFLKNAPKKAELSRLSRHLILFAIVVFVGFYGASSLVGRSAKLNFIDYISFYLGVPIPSFESYLSGFATETPNHLKTDFSCEKNAYKSAYKQAYDLYVDSVFEDAYDSSYSEVYSKLNDTIVSAIENNKIESMLIQLAQEKAKKSGKPLTTEKISEIKENYQSIAETISLCYKENAQKVALAAAETKKSELFGGETFRGIHQSLARYHLSDVNITTSHEWVRIGSSSNIYTAIRNYFADFGIPGVILLEFFFGFLWTIFYLLVKNRGSLLLLLIYANYFHVLIDQIRDDLFYFNFNTSTLSYLLIFIILYLLIIKLPKKYTHPNKNLPSLSKPRTSKLQDK